MLLDGRDVIEFRGLIQILVMSFFSVKWVDPINEGMTCTKHAKSCGIELVFSTSKINY